MRPEQPSVERELQRVIHGVTSTPTGWDLGQITELLTFHKNNILTINKEYLLNIHRAPGITFKSFTCTNYFKSFQPHRLTRKYEGSNM